MKARLATFVVLLVATVACVPREPLVAPRLENHDGPVEAAGAIDRAHDRNGDEAVGTAADAQIDQADRGTNDAAFDGGNDTAIDLARDGSADGVDTAADGQKDACQPGVHPGTWRAISTEGAPRPRGGHSAVWTGKEMIIWGGAVSGTMFDINVNDGARYDPSTDRWTAMSTVAAPAPRVGHAAAWIEKTHEMMIWGGIEGSDAGGLYNTDTNSWRSLPLDGAPTSRWVPALVATGDEAIVWCGRAGDQPVSGDGAVYDPAANRWRPVATEGAPPCNLEAPYAWTGREFIVWGGNGTVRTNGELFAGHPSVLGGLYDPVLDRWRPLAGTPPPGRWAASGVFGDGSFIVTGGVTSLMGDAIADGAIYDIAAGTWRVLPSSVDLGPIFPRGGGVWLAGGTLGCSGAAAFWGGSLLAGGGTDDGVLYLPGTDQWEHMAFAGAPTSRYRHTEVSTGTTVIVWGGSSMGVLTDTGGVYTP